MCRKCMTHNINQSKILSGQGGRDPSVGKWILSNRIILKSPASSSSFSQPIKKRHSYH